MKASGHSEIALATVEVLRRYAPHENYAYFYLGNWLTDFSQLRSPVDFAAQLTTVRRTVTGDTTFEALGHALALELMGEPPLRDTFRTSNLGRYVKHFALIVGWDAFCRRPPAAQRIPFDAFLRHFEAGFTQYYAHEHLDRFPRERAESSSVGRRVYGYLEEDLEYAAEWLTIIEHDWATLAARVANLERRAEELPPERRAELESRVAAARAEREEDRQELLVRFGHAVHAVEDFFAHTNAVDFAMRFAGRTPPVGPDTVLAPPTREELRRDDNQKRSVPQDARRKFERRLRRELDRPAEATDDRGLPLPPQPLVAEERVVSGAFDGPDMLFSLAGMFEESVQALMDLVRPHIPAHLRSASTQEQTGAIVAALDWTRARGRAEKREMQERWSAIFAALSAPPEVEDAHRSMMEIDWHLRRQAIGARAFTIPGIMKVLATDARMADTKRFADGTPWSERPGSHALLAKDGPSNSPGYDEAMRLATRVGTHIAETMMRRARPAVRAVTLGGNQRAVLRRHQHTDWLELLRYFCGHPEEAALFPVGDDARAPTRLVATHDAHFAPHATELDPGATQALLAWARTLSTDYPEAQVRIAGHSARPEGEATLATVERGRRLAAARGEWVVEALASTGLRLSGSESLGDSAPIADNRTEAGRAQNRRVELRAYAQLSGPQRWWERTLDKGAWPHGHVPVFLSRADGEQRAQASVRARLEAEYDAHAPRIEAEYARTRAEDWREAVDRFDAFKGSQ
jgi:outer membrane protein OmpA-like peptidoglycan-associated protein